MTDDDPDFTVLDPPLEISDEPRSIPRRPRRKAPIEDRRSYTLRVRIRPEHYVKVLERIGGRDVSEYLRELILRDIDDHEKRAPRHDPRPSQQLKPTGQDARAFHTHTRTRVKPTIAQQHQSPINVDELDVFPED